MKNWSELKIDIIDTHPYRIVVGREVLKNTTSFLSKDITPKLVIVGEGIASKNPWVKEELSNVFEEILILPDGEESKSLETALSIVEKLWELKADRWSALGVVAGGSLGDTAAFAASLYLRGIPLIMYPTTMLAMVDSSLGGKTAVNWKGYKNILGSFYHPWLIIDDLKFIDTLPERVYRASLAEVLKYGITLDKNFFGYLNEYKRELLNREEEVLKKTVLKSAELKLFVVSVDPRERKGVREVLNFGHTVGHVLESASKFKLLHGESVALGMIVEAGFADKKGFCKGCMERVKEIIEMYEIIKGIQTPKISKEEYIEYLKRDKKRVGDKLRLPVLKEIGSWELKLIPLKEFAEVTYDIMVNVLWS